MTLIKKRSYLTEWGGSRIRNACTLRVTNQCNLKCRHCAFRSDPEHTDQISIEACKKINTWVPSGVVLNIMGGEVTVLENYPEILIELSRERDAVRLVTNGFWANRSVEEFFDTIKQIEESKCSFLDIAVSEDHFHNKFGNKAIKALQSGRDDIKINIVYTYDIEDNNVTPIGRA